MPLVRESCAATPRLDFSKRRQRSTGWPVRPRPDNRMTFSVGGAAHRPVLTSFVARFVRALLAVERDAKV